MTTRATRSPRRRTVVALAVVLAVLVAFIVRLVDIQVVSARELRADSQGLGLLFSRDLYGSRGEIVDENGQILASNVMQYDADLDPKNIFGRSADDDALGRDGAERWPAEAAQIAAITGQTPEEVEQIVADAVASNPDSQWVQLKKGLSTDQYVQLRDLRLPYLTMPQHPARTYPDGAVGGNLVGFVGSDGAPLAGLEISENDCLTPTNGRESYERGKDGVVIPGTQEVTPAENGGLLQLTINRDLQWFMTQLIAEQVQNQNANWGSIFVVEVKTGKVRAAAEYPTVDPNDVAASDPDDRGSRIFAASFEPGSTFKPLTAAALIDQGVASPLEPVIPAAGREELRNGITINDVFSHDTFNYTLTGALVDSSNVALSKFGDLVSQETRYDYLKKFGIGDGSAIGFDGEAKGNVPAPPWDDASHWTTTFGQYYTTTIPEEASFYQAIANGGLQVPLRLVESCTAADGTVVEPELPAAEQVVKPSTADAVTDMLENVYMQVANHDTIAVPGYRVASKTGTAEKHDPETGGYKSGIYFTTMAGFAPADDPEYVVLLTLDEPQKTRMSAANAPGFQKAMTQVLKTYRVMPSGSAGPEILPKYE